MINVTLLSIYIKIIKIDHGHFEKEEFKNIKNINKSYLNFFGRE